MKIGSQVHDLALRWSWCNQLAQGLQRSLPERLRIVCEGLAPTAGVVAVSLLTPSEDDVCRFESVHHKGEIKDNGAKFRVSGGSGIFAHVVRTQKFALCSNEASILSHPDYDVDYDRVYQDDGDGNNGIFLLPLISSEKYVIGVYELRFHYTHYECRRANWQNLWSLLGAWSPRCWSS